MTLMGSRLLPSGGYSHIGRDGPYERVVLVSISSGEALSLDLSPRLYCIGAIFAFGRNDGHSTGFKDQEQ